ncbi:MAG: DNA repair protein RecN [Gammaproteobacteria bacterium]|jgi:DNA repair protein RecN (Recombination protein N)|nr:DNA repair protein RecN [Gammaproteobacteria bacterium]
MLQQLSIQNYATVDRLEIEFQPGMSVITGETGAGKSIILGALGLTLGDRADKTVVRSGANKTDICAEFDTSNIKEANRWLQENDLALDDSRNCILRRVVNADGRSKGYINDSSVTMANLKTLGEMLLDIHSQHEHQSLLQRLTHQRLLDEFSVDKKFRDKLLSTFKQWQQNFREMNELSNQSEEYSAQTQLLAYQLFELDELKLGENEVASLEAEFKNLNSADETLSGVSTALSLCRENEDHSVLSLVHSALAALRELPSKTSRIDAIIGLLESSEIQLGEAVSDLSSFQNEFEANPERLEQVNMRLSALHTIARKHKVKPAELTKIIADLRTQLSRFQNSDEELEKLSANDSLLRTQFAAIAKQISEQRHKGARELANQINKQLQELEMPHARLEVSLAAKEGNDPSISGLETIEFLVSTNPGQDAKPLAKIASGGELSRISLAIQVITAQTSRIPSLVFDEVDVGIGGGVAIVVGELLRGLGEKTQILCVTHQAQVAGQGHHHFFVSKQSEKQSTLTHIKELHGDRLVKEIARMLGGNDFSEESLAHAEKMVASS